MNKTPVAISVSKVRARFHDLVVTRQINLTFGAVRDGCTNIPLAAGNARLDETILSNGFSGHRDTRFVHPDPPELIRFWKF